MSVDYDVIVAGAGPGGSTVAYELARRGVRVGVFEKQQLPDRRLQAARILLDCKFDCLPVVESGALVGVVTEIDCLRAFLSLTGSLDGEGGESTCRKKYHQAENGRLKGWAYWSVFYFPSLRPYGQSTLR